MFDNYQNFHLNKLEKEKEIKPNKVKREIVTLRAEINLIESKYL